MANQAYLSFAVAALAIAIIKFIGDYIKSSKYKLPPRVPGPPILGNTFQIPSKQQGPWAKELAEKYGEM
jgi:hypothetical protein